MSGSISLSAMPPDRPVFSFATILPGADIRYKPFRNAQYDLGFNNPKIKANSCSTTPEGKR